MAATLRLMSRCINLPHNHISLVTDRRSAAEAAARILDFMQQVGGSC